MSNVQSAALDRLFSAIRGMNDFEKGRLIGIGEGLITAITVGAVASARPDLVRLLRTPARETEEVRA